MVIYVVYYRKHSPRNRKEQLDSISPFDPEKKPPKYFDNIHKAQEFFAEAESRNTKAAAGTMRESISRAKHPFLCDIFVS